MNFEKRKFLTTVLMLILLVPTITSGIKITPVKAALIGVITDRGIDTDGDGKYEYLRIGVEVNLPMPGLCNLWIWHLKDAEGNLTYVLGGNTTYLDAGTHLIYTDLYGPAIYAQGLDPAYINNIRLDYSGSPTLSLNNVALDRTYSHAEFEASADLTGKISDRGVDTDGDGKYNYLEVKVEVNVTKPGIYLITAAQLLDTKYQPIQPTIGYYPWDKKEIYLSAGLQQVSLSFYGPDLHYWPNRYHQMNPAYVTITLHENKTFLDSLNRVPLLTTYNYIDFDVQFNDIEVKFIVDPDGKVSIDGSLDMTDLVPRYSGPPMFGTVIIAKDGTLTLVSGEYSLVIPPYLLAYPMFGGYPGRLIPVGEQWPFNATTLDMHMEYLKQSPGIMNSTVTVNTVLPPILTSMFPLNATDIAASGEYYNGEFYGSMEGTLWANLSEVFKMIPLPFSVGFEAPSHIHLDYSEGEYNGTIDFYLAPGLPIKALTVGINGNLSSICLNGTVTVPYGTYFGTTINKTVIDQIEYLFENIFNASQDTPGSLLNSTGGRLECPLIEIQRENVTIPLLGPGERITFKICIRVAEKYPGSLVTMLMELYRNQLGLPVVPGTREDLVKYVWILNALNQTLHKIKDVNIDIEYTPDTMLDFWLNGKIPVEDILEQLLKPIPIPEIWKELYPGVSLPDKLNATTMPEIWSLIQPFIEGLKQCSRSNLNSTVNIAYNHTDQSLTLRGNSLIDTERLTDGLSMLPADISYSILSMLNLQLPLITRGADVTNTGAVGFVYSIDGSIIAFSTSESMVGADLNGDGDTGDTVIRYYNMTDGTTTNTGAVGVAPTVSGSIIAFFTSEGMIGKDLNGDNDTADVVVRYYNMTDRRTINTGKEGYAYSVSDRLIIFHTPEGMVGADLNGDGDTNDDVIRYYNMADGTTTNTGAVGGGAKVSGSIIVFVTSEGMVGEDLNGDGDIGDSVVRYYNMTDGKITNTKASGSGPKISGEIVAFTTHERAVGIDLNLDGDLDDYVVRYYNITDGMMTNTGATGFVASMKDEIIAIYTYEMMISRRGGMQGWDLNNDRDTSDPIVRYYNITSHIVINTGIVGVNPQISNSIMAFHTYEGMVGADLNGDGDMGDYVIQYCTIPELPEVEAQWAQLSVTYADFKFDVDASLSVEGDINEAAAFLKDAFLFNIVPKPWSNEAWLLYETMLDISDFNLGIELNQTYARGYINSLVLSPPTDPISATAFKMERLFNLLQFGPPPPYAEQRFTVAIRGGSNGTHCISLFNPGTVPPPDIVLKDAQNRIILMIWNNVTLSSLKNLEFIIVPGVQAGEVITEPEKITPETPVIIDAKETLRTLINITGVSDQVSVMVFNVTEPEGIEPPPGTWKVLGNYIQVAVSNEAVSVNATIRMYYTDQQVAQAGVAESSLKIYRWNGTDWVPIEPSYVNTQENYVWAYVNRFSIFALMGDMPPIAVTASVSNLMKKSLNLAWTQNIDPDFARYEVLRSTAGGAPVSIANITNKATTSLPVSGLSPSTTYYFTVRVWDSVGLYTDSAQVIATTLAPPTAVIALVSDITENSLKLTWTQSPDPFFARYEIYRSTTQGVLGTLIANETNKATTRLTVSNLSPGTTYYFTVRVVDAEGLNADYTQIPATTAVPIWQQPWFIGTIAAVIVVAAAVSFLVLKRKGTKGASE